MSSALCHLGNISHRLGHTVPEHDLRERVRSNWALSEAEGRMIEHLHANNVDLDVSRLTRGMPLLIDVKAARFTGPDSPRPVPVFPPPMGWSSWNSFSNTVNSENIMQQAQAMASNGMKEAGYQYINIDEGWWLGQLHKSLFDEQELGGLLREAGFASFTMFAYGYPGDAVEIPVTMGFYASRAQVPADRLRNDCVAFVTRFTDVRIRLSTLQWID